MGLLSQTISHLFGGVSQQAPVLRSSSQGQAQVNGLSSPVRGLTKRPSTNFVSALNTGNYGESSLFHVVDRDESTRYQIVVNPGGELKVFDMLTGAEREVTIEEGCEDYIKAANPSRSLRMMTVEDSTFVVNRDVTPKMEPWRYTQGQPLKATVTLNRREGGEVAFFAKLSRFQTLNLGYAFETFTSNHPDFNPLVGPPVDWIVKSFDSANEMQAYLRNEYVPSLFPDPAFWRWPIGAQVEFPSGTRYVSNEMTNVDAGSGGDGTLIMPNGSLAPYVGALEVDPLAPNSAENFSQNVWLHLESLGYTSNVSYERLLSPINFSGYVKRSSPTAPWEKSWEPTQVVQFYGAFGWIGVEILTEAWYCKWTDSTTTVAGGLNRDSMIYDGYPDVGLTNLVGPENGLVVNGVVFMETFSTDTPTVMADYALRINQQFDDLAADVVGESLVITTTAPGAQLSVKEFRKGYATVVYEYPQEIPERIYVFIKAGVPEQSYKVSINGNVAFFNTPKSDNADHCKPEHIAAELATQINSFPGGYTAVVYGRFIEVIPPAPGATFDYYDSWSSMALSVMKNQVESESALPPRFKEGVPIKVGRGDTGYYVHFVAGLQKKVSKPKSPLAEQIKESNLYWLVVGDQVEATVNGWNILEAEEAGGWEETAYPYEDRMIDRYSMPHVIVSEADGTFTLKAVSWLPRVVGDEESAPAPSFIGRPIQDLFFYRNRLGFMTNESISMSKNGSYFDFFPDTARQVLDSDPIDVQISHTKVSILHSAVVFNGSLVLFSEKTQFVMSAGELLTPRSVNIRPANEYDSFPLLKPFNTGDTVFFINHRSGFTQVMEYQSLGTQGNFATDITGHVPTYIPKELWGLSASSTENCLTVFKDKQVYTYKYLWGGENRKVQDSWSVWEFDSKVLNAAWIRSKLYLTLEKDGKVVLEYMDFNLEPNVTGLNVHMDHQKRFEPGDMDAFIGPSGITRILNLPYSYKETLKVFDDDGAEVPYTVFENKLTFPLNFNKAVTVGFPFSFSYEFSPIFMRNQEGTVQVDGHLTLRTMTVSFTGTKSFTAEVTARGRQAHKSVFSSEDEADGTKRFTVGSDGQTVRIVLKDDTVHPLAFVNAAWEGNFQRRSRLV